MAGEAEPIATVLEWFIGVITMIILAWNGWLSRSIHENSRVFAEELEKVKSEAMVFSTEIHGKIDELNKNVHNTQLDIARNMVTKTDLKELKDALYDQMAKSEARLIATVKQTNG